VIKLNPKSFKAYANRGLTRLQQGQEADARRDFDQCLRLNPSLQPLLKQRIEQMGQRLAAKH